MSTSTMFCIGLIMAMVGAICFIDTNTRAHTPIEVVCAFVCFLTGSNIAVIGALLWIGGMLA